ncbi:ABC transporter permease [Alphaproteobacteria bacterium]|nr:ABC transporter permease [Alphaproteobacteria bacterium]
MNWVGIISIYSHEMDRMKRTIIQSVLSPVITTSLYFIVFGSAIGSRIPVIEGVSYGSFIVPGLIMLTVLTQSISNASSGIFFPKFLGTINEIYAAPLSPLEIIIGFVGAATTKSIVLGLLIFATAHAFVPMDLNHPFLMFCMLILTSLTFSLVGFVIGIWATNWEQMSLIPTIVVTPLVFLGGSFYSISMLPEFWQNVSYFNPILYLVDGFRWSFYGISDVNIFLSLSVIFGILTLCIGAIILMFVKGYKIKN